jgi:hypothetical protein
MRRKRIVGAFQLATLIAVVGLLPLFKHPMFAEEREWRLIYFPIWEKPDLQFREIGGEIVPYLAVDISTVSGDGLRRLPIVQILHAPCAEPQLRKRSVEALLEAKGYSTSEVSVAGSDIPLR